jgi:hypothetical protein
MTYEAAKQGPGWDHERMSISVELERVRDEASQRAGAYLLTVSEDARPHVVAVTVDWDGESLVMGAGRSSARNATARSDVTVLWPPAESGGYSLIVDGDAEVAPSDDGGQVTVRPTRAVLHRPGTGSAPGCASDCVPLLRP